MKLYVIGIILFFTSFFPIHFQEYQYPFISVLAVILLALPSYYVLITKLSHTKAILTILLISVFAMCIETIGIVTGFPYSHFTYSESLGYKLFSITPIAVFFAFTPLVLGAIRLADCICKTRLKKILLAIFFVVYIDVILDPVMVAQNTWIWQNSGIYYGVPLMNFFGWLFSSTIAIGIYYAFFKTKTIAFQESSYILTLFFFTGAAFFLGLLIPTILGFIFLIGYYLLQK